MEHVKRNISDLLTSVSGVMIFLSINEFLDLSGFTKFAPLLIAFGILILFFAKEISNKIPFKSIHKALLITISHVLIFIGLKGYLAQYVSGYWFIVIFIGIVLLTYSDKIAGLITRR